jgi:hypothetical protein
MDTHEDILEDIYLHEIGHLYLRHDLKYSIFKEMLRVILWMIIFNL